MWIRSLVTPASPPGLTAHHHGHHHHNYSQPPHSHYHHHGIRAWNTILIITIPIFSLVLLFSIYLLIKKLRRPKSTRSYDTSKTTSSNNSSLCMFNAHSSINFNSSPDVKSGCLYRGISGCAFSGKSRGVQVFTYKELELATNKFSEANVIGNGAFGVVYRGTLSDGTVSAIKVLRRGGKQGEREFRIEVDILSRVHSPCLVELLGYCADQNHRLLIFEFMPNGSLQHHIHPSHKQHQPLDWVTRLQIAFDCARALEFLHEHAVPSVIHRNFKCSNILLDHNFRAKASDFGLAMMGSDKINGQISTRVVGTTGYMAPEYASTGKLTTKSDVYSYGVVLLELLTGRLPIDTNRPPEEHFLVSWALPRLINREKVFEMVDPALQGQYSKKELIQVAVIAAVCVQSEADYRPFMTDVVQSLIPLVKSFPSTYPSTSSRYHYPTVSPRS